MQLGHCAERDIINLKSNQLKTERKEISGSVLKSSSPLLVLAKVNQFCFVFLIFPSFDFLFSMANNKGKMIKNLIRQEEKKGNIAIDINRKQQYLFSSSPLTSRYHLIRWKINRNGHTDTFKLRTANAKSSQQTSFLQSSQVKCTGLRSHPDAQQLHEQLPKYYYAECHSLQYLLLYQKALHLAATWNQA